MIKQEKYRGRRGRILLPVVNLFLKFVHNPIPPLLGGAMKAHRNTQQSENFPILDDFTPCLRNDLRNDIIRRPNPSLSMINHRTTSNTEDIKKFN